MKNIFIQLKECQDCFTSAEVEISQYIQKNANEITNMTIRDLANETLTSASSIVRFCRKIGFKGYSDFQRALIATLAESKAEETVKENLIDQVTFNNIKILEESLHLIDENIVSKCIELLGNAKRILLFGVGSSYYVSRDFYLRLLQLNIPAISNEGWDSQYFASKNSNKDDVALIFSYSGQTDEIIACMKEMKQNHTPMISVTKYAPSTISKLADYNLYIATNEPLYRKDAMVSRIMMLNVVDILYNGFIVKNYDEAMKPIVRT